MCKEIPVDKVVDPKRIIRENMGGGEAQGVADPPPPKKKGANSHFITIQG
jgi:hypothetical protein